MRRGQHCARRWPEIARLLRGAVLGSERPTLGLLAHQGADTNLRRVVTHAVLFAVETQHRAFAVYVRGQGHGPLPDAD